MNLLLTQGFVCLFPFTERFRTLFTSLLPYVVFRAASMRCALSSNELYYNHAPITTFDID